MKLLVIAHAAFMRTNRILFREIAALGTDTTILSPEHWRCDFKLDKIKMESRKDEKFALLSGKTAFNGKINYYFFTSPLLLNMGKIKPDIVFIYQEPWSFSALQAAIVSRIFGAEPVFYTMENMERRLRFPLPLIEKIVFRLCKNAFALTDEGIELLRKKGFRGRVEKLYLGVDTKLFRKRNALVLKKKLGLNGFVIGYMGRLIKEKSVETILEACSGFKFDFSIAIDAGELYIEQRRLLERKAQELGLRERVVFVDPDYDEMPTYMSALDVLVLPSKTT
ncbi:glycosyltransferase, partial [Candidatus Micrarchaeota archaeon]|nr:glycosyltransferase [Candidatus Micrarchaeota archaeon]